VARYLVQEHAFVNTIMNLPTLYNREIFSTVLYVDTPICMYIFLVIRRWVEFTSVKLYILELNMRNNLT
jgi:hypothetical protein